MYLKKLELQGFKSFPEYTLIEFGPGMTAVVGPNGSGKSNVTDAIRWVLGEQSVKSLRGGKMEDVIFIGTQSRKAMNYAEVSVTFDNSDHSLDYEYNEIQITRRLYRSGDSEYQINHVNCRLKDIVTLFMDTGLGKDGYSIIGQGRVDEILSPKSEDRRRVIEEASGIVKYKARKEEAERKLKNTEDNLEKIDVVLNELQDRIVPLKDQAEKAIEYHRTYEELKKNDIALLVHKIRTANEAMGGQGDLKSKLEEDLKVNEDRYLEMRRSNSELTEKSEKLEEAIEDSRQELSDITERIYDVSSDRKVALTQKNKLEEDIEAFSSEESEIRATIARLIEENESNKSKAQKLLDKANEAKSHSEKLTTERDELLEEFKKSSRLQDGTRKQIEDKSNEILNCKEQINAYETKISGMEERLKELSSDRFSRIEITKELETHLYEADKAFRELMQQEGAVTSDINEHELKLAGLKQKNSKFLEQYEKENRRSMAIQSRISALTDLEKRKEGYQESVKRLLQHVERTADKEKIVGVLGDLISVEKEHETAIEIALGNAIHNIVTDTESDAAYLIDVLKTNRLGRVTFLPIENIKPRNLDKDQYNTVYGMTGFIGVASDLTEHDPNISDIISNLLGRIIICDELDNARKIASRLKYQVRIITLQGDAINPGGSLTGGSVHKNATGILGRGREIEQLTAEHAELDKKLAIYEAERQQLDEEIYDVRREIEQLEEQLKYFSVERAKAETTYTNLKDRLAEMKRQVKNGEEAIETLSREKLRLGDELEEAKLVFDETEQSLRELRQDILQNDTDTKSINERLDKLRDEIAETVASAERAIAERKGVLQLSGVLEREKNAHKESLARKQQERDDDKKTLEELDLKISDYDELLISLGNDEKDKSAKIKELSSSRAELEKELSGFLGKLTDCQDTINSIKNELSTLTNKYERYIEEIDNSKNRLWEDYEVTFDNVCESCDSVTNAGESAQLISKLRNKIKNIGPVNLNSIEEYKEVSDRYEFMSSQRNDVYNAKIDIENCIAQLIDEMQTQFVTHFETINENFKTVFADLFNGGTAEISLDSDDVLNCNIEIKAQPPGKKLQSLSPLSGGEKCLTAIALLFAILQLKPSPFVILDEVEAALDDVNVSRFTDFVRRYCARSQFIIVTHRKGTMEACDRMYGVTMQERGVSKILSMRLGDN